MDRPSLHYQTITDLADGIRKGGITSSQMVQNLLDRIKSLDGQLNAFRLTCPERALEQAAAADRQIRDGKDPGILHGIPYAVKDLFDVKGLPTTAGASLLEKNASLSMRGVFHFWLTSVGSTVEPYPGVLPRRHRNPADA